jgi:RNA polymerase sigma-70 factor, ECF subfamily
MSINPMYHHTPDKLQDEVEWIRRAKSDPEQFGPLYAKYHEQIYRYIYQRMDDMDEAADVTSQVFLKAMNNLYKYEDRGVPFGAWLYRIAKSELYQTFREQKAVRTVNIETVQLTDFMETVEEEDNSVNKSKLVKALSFLKEDDLQLIEMRFFERRAFKEIGEILDLTENNAKVKCFRALEKLKKIFNKR